MKVSTNWKKFKSKNKILNEPPAAIIIETKGSPETERPDEDTTSRDLNIIEQILLDKTPNTRWKEEEEGEEEVLPRKKIRQDSKVGKFIGMDCEMVGVAPAGLTSVLAR
jgi:hypothetical protein